MPLCTFTLKIYLYFMKVFRHLFNELWLLWCISVYFIEMEQRSKKKKRTYLAKLASLSQRPQKLRFFDALWLQLENAVDRESLDFIMNHLLSVQCGKRHPKKQVKKVKTESKEEIVNHIRQIDPGIFTNATPYIPKPQTQIQPNQTQVATIRTLKSLGEDQIENKSYQSRRTNKRLNLKTQKTLMNEHSTTPKKQHNIVVYCKPGLQKLDRKMSDNYRNIKKHIYQPYPLYVEPRNRKKFQIKTQFSSRKQNVNSKKEYDIYQDTKKRVVTQNAELGSQKKPDSSVPWEVLSQINPSVRKGLDFMEW